MPLIFKGQNDHQKFRTWGAVAGAAIGVVGSAMTSKGGSSTNGGAGTTTNTKEPWAAAQPWITSNMTSGQALQNQYAQTPFNAQQLGAYQNLGNQTNYMNALTPSLLGQISGQQVGFNRANPDAKPNAYNFNGTGNAGLLGMLSNPASGSTSAANPAPVAPAPAAPAQVGFTQDSMSGPASAWMKAMGATPTQGGYGSFKYGDPAPAPGSQAYSDYLMYKQAGGQDPNNLYGWNNVGMGGGGPGTSAASGGGTGGAAAY